MTKTESTLGIKPLYIIKSTSHTSDCPKNLGVFIVFFKPFRSGKTESTLESPYR